MMQTWLRILAIADEKALEGVKVKIGGVWCEPLDNGLRFRKLGTNLIMVGRITEIKLPINEEIVLSAVNKIEA